MKRPEPRRLLEGGFWKDVRLRAEQLARDRPRRARPARGREPRGLRLLHHADVLAAYLMMTREHVVGFFRSLVRPERLALASTSSSVRHGSRTVRRRTRAAAHLLYQRRPQRHRLRLHRAGSTGWSRPFRHRSSRSSPIFGSIASAVPAVAIGLTQGLRDARRSCSSWILGIHQLEANLLNPKIMGDAAKIHPVLVVFSLLVGEHFFGPVGALLAVPCMSLPQTVFLALPRPATNRERSGARAGGLTAERAVAPGARGQTDTTRAAATPRQLESDEGSQTDSSGFDGCSRGARLFSNWFEWKRHGR